MKNIILLFASILFLLTGCSKNNNPVEPAIQSDSELRANIIGVWTNPYSINHYYNDGSFQDTLKEVLPNNIIITRVINGNYEIENGILSFDIRNCKIINDSANIMPFQISFSKYKLKMTKDLLYYYPLDILTRMDDNSKDIWGKWSTSQWAISYNPNKQNPVIIGQLNYQYIFNQDSMTVTFGTIFPVNSDSVFHFTKEKITYEPPNLSWDLYYNKKIEFHNSQMYMFENLDNHIIPLKKIK